MKNLRICFIVAALMLCLSAGTMTTSATPPTGAEPYDAPYLDTESHTLPPYSSAWYKFEFVVDHPGFICKFIACPDRAVYHGQVVIRLPGLEKSGLTFAVYAPSQIKNWRDADPVGRSNPDNGDLVWSGEADDNGVWHLLVVNDRNYAIDYRFVVSGVRFLLSRLPEIKQAPVSLSEQLEQSRKPAPTPSPISIANTDPYRAAPIDGQTHPIAAQSELWYIASFPMNQNNITIRLLDGANSGLSFEVYMPAQVATWWKDDPLGRGDSDGDDLVWSGAPDITDKRYVRVINQTNRAVDFLMLIQTPLPIGVSNLPFGRPQ